MTAIAKPSQLVDRLAAVADLRRTRRGTRPRAKHRTRLMFCDPTPPPPVLFRIDHDDLTADLNYR